MRNIFLLLITSMVIASSFSIEGMTCGVGCAQKIKAQVASLDGVSSCEINFGERIMEVNYDKSKINDNQIIAHLEKNTIYRATLLGVDNNIKSANSKTSCNIKDKNCCSNEEKKVGFFKKIFSWF